MVDRAATLCTMPDPAAAPPSRDQPWLMRTYSGHSTARASNDLYRANLAKGQTGLSIAFDLPTAEEIVGVPPALQTRSLPQAILTRAA